MGVTGILVPGREYIIRLDTLKYGKMGSKLLNASDITVSHRDLASALHNVSKEAHVENNLNANIIMRHDILGSGLGRAKRIITNALNRDVYDYESTFPTFVLKDYAKKTYWSWIGKLNWHMLSYNILFVERDYFVVVIYQLNLMKYLQIIDGPAFKKTGEKDPVPYKDVSGIAPVHKAELVIGALRIGTDTIEDIQKSFVSIKGETETEDEVNSLANLMPLPNSELFFVHTRDLTDDIIFSPIFDFTLDIKEIKKDNDKISVGFLPEVYHNRLRAQQWWNDFITVIKDSPLMIASEIGESVSGKLSDYSAFVLKDFVGKMLAEHLGTSYVDPTVDYFNSEDTSNRPPLVMPITNNSIYAFMESKIKNFENYENLLQHNNVNDMNSDPVGYLASQINQNRTRASAAISEQSGSGGASGGYGFFLDYYGGELEKAIQKWWHGYKWYVESHDRPRVIADHNFIGIIDYIPHESIS